MRAHCTPSSGPCPMLCPLQMPYISPPPYRAYVEGMGMRTCIKASMFATHVVTTQECQRVGCFAGTLPASWGGQDAFASLSTLQVAYTSLTGQLPPEWGSSSSFQDLSVLQIFNSSISGTDHLGPPASLPDMELKADYLCAQVCNFQSCGTLVR